MQPQDADPPPPGSIRQLDVPRRRRGVQRSRRGGSLRLEEDVGIGQGEGSERECQTMYDGAGGG